jgi:hypothetical protein
MKERRTQRVLCPLCAPIVPFCGIEELQRAEKVVGAIGFEPMTSTV